MSRPNSLSYLFNWTDPISTYAGNIHDSLDFYGIIREFGRLGVTATEYVGEHGKRYIKISGHAGLRRIITGTRYGASNPKMLSMGIGQQGLNSNIVKGVKFCIIFSVMYRTIELIFKDEYTLAEFIGNITADMAKVAITAAVTWAAGTMLGAMAVVGGSIIVSAGIVLLVGVAVTIGLDYIDKKYKISEKIIEVIKSQIERNPRSPEVDLQKIFNTWPR
ncbi:hypothetical protein [Xenorhabdus griffiniae]|uniref:ImpA domain-containing protein n=1 Tax=Xenorhabdus griffiniae TaxID=351672 RepID=A0ABY9XI17_9GAMM|nr:hypothetical protein [Xenorhabdus griffiniae]MBD1229487.1 hypothetical protein [Xenorhabdus griffiniae]MBE8589312.1 hypothetical protein [Xenorhabdus griffiniae]WMV72584.1 hypothetical protein QL128_00490 [Xenorhabdus griffiniae]WNH02262.1 hypothetical protein QL112_000490 [Xenorhabdus griffiniae]